MRLDSPDIIGSITVSTVNNAVGDILTYSGNTITRRTATQILTDIGASSSNNNITAVSLTTTTLTLTRAAGNLTASVPTFNQNTTGSAATLTTARTLTIGSTGKTFNGSADVSWSLAEIGAEAAFTTLGVAKGGTGASTLTGVLVGNGTSAVTAVAGTASQLLRRNAGNTAYEFFTIAGSDITGAALTKTDDTNVTLTLGGTPATSLLRAASITLGWTGTLSIARGGTGLSALGTANQLLRVNAGATALEYFTPTFLTTAITSLNGLTGATQTFANDTNVTITSATTTHTIGWSGQLAVSRGGTGASTLTGVLVGNGTSAVTAVAGTASQILRRNAGNTAYEFFTIAGSDITGAALTSSNDTNVTITLGGTPSTSLLRAASITLGWTGQLAVSRGGTGLSALGTANQLLRVNAGATALEYFTPSFLTVAITSLNGLTGATQTFANDTNVTITSATTTHTIGWSGQLSVARGGTGASTLTGVLVGNGTSAVTAVAGTASQVLRRNAGNTAYEFFTIAGSDVTGAALTKTDDTNVTLTLGGTPTTALLRAASITVGWTGTLAIARGGTGLSSLGTANQLLRVNAGATALEYFTPTFLTAAITSLNGLTAATQTFAIGSTAQSNNIGWVSATSTHTLHIPDASQTVRGVVTTSAQTFAGVKTFSSTPVFSANIEVQGQVYSPINAKGNSGTGTVTFNWNDGNIQTVTLTGNCTFAFSNPQSGASYQIIITQDGTGGRTITWPTIHWEGRTVPTLTGTLNSKDIVTVTYDGTNYNAVIAKNFGTP
jgi:hypothetical protein